MIGWKNNMGKNDIVICLGDGWMAKGAIGRVLSSSKNASTILVSWTDIPKGTDEYKKYRGSEVSLFHNIHAVTKLSDTSDPNLLFLEKKGGL
jgi:hypothetical protein